MATTPKDLHALASNLSGLTGTEYRAVRCVFGHGYPRCGCTWRLVEVAPGTGAYITVTYLGDTIPKAHAALCGVLLGLSMDRKA